MVMSLSQATDLVSSAVANHQKRVAYIACCLAQKMGFDRDQRNHILMAGALHDVGALSLSERLNALSFEVEQPLVQAHAQVGARLLRTFPLFAGLATSVEHHHCQFIGAGSDVPKAAHLLHLSDRVDVILD